MRSHKALVQQRHMGRVVRETFPESFIIRLHDASLDLGQPVSQKRLAWALKHITRQTWTVLRILCHELMFSFTANDVSRQYPDYDNVKNALREKVHSNVVQTWVSYLKTSPYCAISLQWETHTGIDLNSPLGADKPLQLDSPSPLTRRESARERGWEG